MWVMNIFRKQLDEAAGILPAVMVGILFCLLDVAEYNGHATFYVKNIPPL